MVLHNLFMNQAIRYNAAKNDYVVSTEMGSSEWTGSKSVVAAQYNGLWTCIATESYQSG